MLIKYNLLVLEHLPLISHCCIYKECLKLLQQFQTFCKQKFS